MTKLRWTKSGKFLISKCGRFQIERMMISSFRAGCWHTEWRLTDTAHPGWRDDSETLRNAKQFAQYLADDTAAANTMCMGSLFRCPDGTEEYR